MKTILVAVIFVGAIGCSVGKDIQVEFVTAKLINIDTVYRFSKYEKALTWEDDNKIRYTSYLSMEKHVPVGMKMIVMRPR